MVNWLRDTVKIGSRVVGGAAGGIGGFFAGGPVGAAAGAAGGWQLGAEISDSALPTPVKDVRHVSIGAYDTNAGIERNPSKRENFFNTKETQYGFSDKFDKVADPLVASSAQLASVLIKPGTDSTPTKMPKLTPGDMPDPTGLAPSPNYGGQENSKWGVSDIQYPKMPSIGFPLMGSSDQQSSELKIPQVDNTIMQPSGSEITSGTQDDIYGKKWTSPLTKSEITNDLLQQTEDLKKKLQDFQKYNQ